MSYTYDSWGKLLSTTGSLASTLGSGQPFRYRGYVYDTETSLYYLQTRYYDPSTCRFISSDVVLSTGQGVLGHNAYAYCNNCPVPFCDSEGKSIELAFWMFLLWLIGDESDVYFDENSLMCRCLKESDYMNEIIDKSIGKYITNEEYETGTDAFTISNAGYGLYLAVHRFSYEISIQEEYMTIYSSQGKRERVHRYKAKVVVHDTYDFTRLSSWKSFGGAMNNLAYYYDKIIGGNDYEWWATFEHTTDWEKIPEYLRC